jgi:hypothetical protein
VFGNRQLRRLGIKRIAFVGQIRNACKICIGDKGRNHIEDVEVHWGDNINDKEYGY